MILEAREITFSFGQTPALRGASVAVEAGEVLGEPRFQVRPNCGMEQSFTAGTFRGHRRFEQPAGSSTSTKRRSHQGFLLLNGNYCELGHPPAIIRKLEHYVIATSRKEIICLRYTLRL